MIEKSFTVISEVGIHARPATLLVRTASNYDANLTITYNGKEANLKSIMGIMALAIPNGANIRIFADGQDATAAITSLEDVLIQEGFAS
ncbi:phosphocarrier protein HPr [Bacillus massiliigorillae]|uniref:phosphocarrier protein HPr n=1 Tax=Bacillus massiliigorillae TaxID=1243664 RepID=UPI0003A0F11A|nr:phosphocarrier protein HPr [Bacillus massiliigorillae]